MKKPVIISQIGLKSANDCPEKDPKAMKVYAYSLDKEYVGRQNYDEEFRRMRHNFIYKGFQKIIDTNDINFEERNEWKCF